MGLITKDEVETLIGNSLSGTDAYQNNLIETASEVVKNKVAVELDTTTVTGERSRARVVYFGARKHENIPSYLDPSTYYVKVRLKKKPVQSVSQVVWVLGKTESALNITKAFINKVAGYILVPWSSASPSRIYVVKTDYIAGYTEVPVEVKTAVALLALEANRWDQEKGLGFVTKFKIGDYSETRKFATEDTIGLGSQLSKRAYSLLEKYMRKGRFR